MPYKYVYFPVRGRGQAFRYMCADNGIAYEEEVFPMDYAKWGEKKATYVLGQLPVMFDGTFEIGQSNAILRHVARKHNLYGKDDHEHTLIDMLNDLQEDYRAAYIKMCYTDYENGKEPFLKALPDKLALLEKMLAKNHGGNGFFVGNKPSFVDYNIFDLLDDFDILSKGSYDAFPLLKAFQARMAAREKIAKIRQSEEFKKMPVNGNGKQ